MTSSEVTAPADVYAANAHYRRPWYWYDWANSAFVTTTGTVLFGPYITAIAKEAACPGAGDQACTATLDVLGVPISPGSVAPYTVTLATILAAVVLMFVQVSDTLDVPEGTATRLVGAANGVFADARFE